MSSLRFLAQQISMYECILWMNFKLYWALWTSYTDKIIFNMCCNHSLYFKSSYFHHNLILAWKVKVYMFNQIAPNIDWRTMNLNSNTGLMVKRRESELRLNRLYTTYVDSLSRVVRQIRWCNPYLFIIAVNCRLR